MTPIGINHPINIMIQPRYMMTSTKMENISVANGAIMEKPPKLVVEIIFVALIANTDAKSDIITCFLKLVLSEFCLEISGEISAKTIIPKVANADSHSDISKIA